MSLSGSLWTAERVPLERKHGEVVEVVPLHGEKTLDILQYLAIFPMVLLFPALCLTVLYEVSLQDLFQWDTVRSATLVRCRPYLVTIPEETAFATLHERLFPYSTRVALMFSVDQSVVILYPVTQSEKIQQRERNGLYAFDFFLSDAHREVQEAVLMSVKDGDGVTLAEVAWVQAGIIGLEMKGYQKFVSVSVLHQEPKPDEG